ncbi:MAG: type II toxin-antitoxin system PemK/MazF family toxin [Clostridiales Family XIII bacterium]|jgi:mRNA interferase MazF|nr:type II toxin-antitoxin system PemK/MazF family toxin [Clostridiales Family XIII bacterium]
MVKYAQGDIALVAGGAYSSKPRPVLIIQNPKYMTGESVIVIPFTSVGNDEIDTRIPVSPSAENGLDRDCFLEVDKISAIYASYINKRIGRLDESSLQDVFSLAAKLIGA